MSLKKLSCVAAIAALVASPAFAQPTISVDLVRDGGGIAQLDANGDWQWELVVTTDADGSVATELDAAFTDSGLLAGGGIGNTTVFDTPNPSSTTLAWVVPDGDGIVGYQENTGTSEATIAYGSDDVVAGSYVLATFTTEGPATLGSLTSTAAANGLVAQLGVNTTGLSTSYSATATAGDANLDGDVNLDDSSAMLGSFGGTGVWQNGDFTGDGNVNLDDASALLGTFGSSGPAPSMGAAPEPTAAILGLFAGLGLLSTRRRS